MSVTIDNLLFDFSLSEIQVQQARGADLLVQDLINAIREAEFSDEGMQYDKIADASGKDSLGGAVSVGITVNLQDDWQVKWYSNGSYQATISGGNLVGGQGGNPVAYTADVQVKITQSANATVIETGTSGLTAEESTNLSAIKSKTDSLTFTKTGEVDANVQSLNDTELLGTGAEGDKWRG